MTPVFTVDVSTLVAVLKKALHDNVFFNTGRVQTPVHTGREHDVCRAEV